jgi:hypothetical protein
VILLLKVEAACALVGVALLAVVVVREAWRTIRRKRRAEDARVIEGVDLLADTDELDETGILAALNNTSDWVDEALERMIASHRADGEAAGDTLYTGRHSLGRAAGSQAQQVLWNSPTGAFDEITAGVFDTQEYVGLAELIETWTCDSCSTGRDGEPLHVSCHGCACSCSAAEVAS